MSAKTLRSKEVDAYISNQPPEVRRALEDLRLCIWHAAPNISELMNYKIPAFALVNGGKRDQQIMIAGFSKHVITLNCALEHFNPSSASLAYRKMN